MSWLKIRDSYVTCNYCGKKELYHFFGGKSLQSFVERHYKCAFDKDNLLLIPIVFPQFLESYHISEWEKIDDDRWKPWGDSGMCDGRKIPVDDVYCSPIGYAPKMIDGVWYWVGPKFSESADKHEVDARYL